MPLVTCWPLEPEEGPADTPLLPLLPAPLLEPAELPLEPAELPLEPAELPLEPEPDPLVAVAAPLEVEFPGAIGYDASVAIPQLLLRLRDISM